MHIKNKINLLNLNNNSNALYFPKFSHYRKGIKIPARECEWGCFPRSAFLLKGKKNLHLWNGLYQAAWNENTQLNKATEYTAAKKEIIVPLHGLDIEADPSAHSFAPWIPRAFPLLSPWHFCNLFELLWLPTSLSLSHCCPPALALQSTPLAFIFFYPDHCLAPLSPEGLGTSMPMCQSQALGSGLELAVLSWALRTEIARAAGTAGHHT